MFHYAHFGEFIITHGCKIHIILTSLLAVFEFTYCLHPLFLGILRCLDRFTMLSFTR